ncbi:hypothetical protein [Arundinibacter roseus]|uniref:TonB-dependent receptor n=1 Tax=Arundinibacter roseus TaxID=2070510 RepID=A0A4R4KPX7_9BACT|nr:hypothetical protein [Arundinibacter roseus]TDB68986.1 hypothetical protein EZE20_01205 [Arundinibacter roseus]
MSILPEKELATAATSMLLNAQWSYSPNKSRWTYNVWLNNLANEKAIFQTEISDILVGQQVQYLQPRILLAGVSFSF